MKLNSIVCLLGIIAFQSASAEGIALRSSSDIGRRGGQQMGPAVGKSSSSSASTATSFSRGGAGIGVGSQGQSLSIDSHAVYESQARNPVSTAVAPPITSSNDTCMGSTSIGGSAVSFGFSAGTTWTDDNCVMLKNSREMWNMGFKGAALARLCMDGLNKEAFEATGINCPLRRQTTGSDRSVMSTSAGAGSNADETYRY